MMTCRSTSWLNRTQFQAKRDRNIMVGCCTRKVTAENEITWWVHFFKQNKAWTCFRIVMNVSSEVWKWIFKVTKDTFILSLQSAAHNTTAFLDISLGYATMCSLFIGKTNRRRGEDWRNMLEYWPFFACPHKEIDIAIMLLEEVFCLIWNGKKIN